MSDHLLFEAESVEEALSQASVQLGRSIQDLKYEVIEKGSKKIFGIGTSKLAKIKIFESGSAEDAGSETKGTEAVDINKQNFVTDKENNSIPSTNEDVLLNDKDINTLEDSDIDAIADEAISVITKIATLTGAKNIAIEEFEGEEGEIILDIGGEDLSFLIGRHGRTLEAIQTLSSAIVTKRVGLRYPLSVDVEGYRHRRKQKIIEIAQHAASRAKAQDRSVALKPMTAQERRLCHIAIRDIPGVDSSSEGKGNYRHVVVYSTKS